MKKNTKQKLKIEAGKLYRTRNGSKVRIYATDGGGMYPIHGAVWDAIEWALCKWTASGSFWSDDVNGNDIISEWRDDPEIKWNELPPDVVAIAMDAGGAWFGYRKKPSTHGLSWTVSTYGIVQLYPNHIPSFTGDWKDSLFLRPKK